MIKRYDSKKALGLGNMTPDMNKAQKDAIERREDARMEKHFQGYQPVPNGRNFHTWNHTKDEAAEERYRNNFDKIFPNSPGAGL